MMFEDLVSSRNSSAASCKTVRRVCLRPQRPERRAALEVFVLSR
jgi:hypothetical protein